MEQASEEFPVGEASRRQGHAPRGKPEREIIKRHSVVTRLTHWVNVLAILVLLMSGLQIFNAHPRLYWGQAGANADMPFVEVQAMDTNGDGRRGTVRFGRHSIDTTGFLGVSGSGDALMSRGFPAWATLPSYQDLATGRRWHLFFSWVFVINGLLYLIYNAVTGHLRKSIVPRRDELRFKHIWHELKDHARFRWPTGEADKSYNALQKITYVLIIFVALPMMVLTGLSMSPGFNAIAPWTLDLFGGRQSARTLHFISMAIVVGFIVLHVALVLLAGPWNLMRSMVTGNYVVKPERIG